MRFGLRTLVHLVGLTSASVVGSAMALDTADEEAESPEVAWIWGPASRTDCPPSENLQLAVEQLLSIPGLFGGFDAPGVNLRLQAISDEGPDGVKRLDLQLETTQGERLGVRSLQARTCDEMSELSPLVVALMVEPYLNGHQSKASPAVAAESDSEPAALDQPIAKSEQARPSVESEQARPSVESEQARPGVETEKARPRAETLRARPSVQTEKARPSVEAEKARSVAMPPRETIPTYRFACLTKGKLLLGFGPATASPAFGLSCSLGVAQSFSAELSGEYRAPTRNPSRDFKLQAGAIDGRACRARGREWQWGGCAGVGLSWMLAGVSTSTSPATDDRLVGEFLAHLRAQRRARWLLYRLDVGATFPWQRPQYSLVSPDGQTDMLHQPWIILPWMEISAGWIFR